MLIIVVALKAEARPLVRHFGLAEEKTEGPYHTYRSDRVRLVVCGVGAGAARVATAHLVESSDRPSPCLNVGIAGHGEVGLGTPLLIHKVTDRQTATSHFPAFPFSPPCATSPLVTVASPETDYGAPCAYDMEGSGFFAAAAATAGSELAHSLKVVSDNPFESIEAISARGVEELLQDHLALVEDLVSILSDCAADISRRLRNPPLYDRVLQRWHFTYTQRHQLRRLLQRWQALAPDDIERELQSLLHDGALRSSREVVTFLQSHIENLPFSLS